MALTERTVQDKIEIVGDYKHIQVRTATVIERDGVEISRSFSRHVVTPNAYFQYNTTGAWVGAPFTAGPNRYIAVQMTYTTNA